MSTLLYKYITSFHVDSYAAMAALKERHEGEMEPLTREIDRLQQALEESMKKRLTMITR